MKQTEKQVLPLFERFLRDTLKGRRLKTDGSRIKSQSTRNYMYVLKYLQEYELKTATKLRVKLITGNNARIIMAEKKYWRKFYLGFTNFLYAQKGCFDNYVGTVIKVLRIFFKYINLEWGMKTGEFYRQFYVCKEDIPVISLRPDQLQFLINDKAFETKLSASLKKTKDILVFGCTVALRVSDLFSIKFNDIERVGDTYYLPVKTIKTGTIVRIKLPRYAMEIVEIFKNAAKKRKQVFPPIPRTRFNSQLKQLALLAGWTAETGKYRNRRGVAIEETLGNERSTFRFCDQMSSHIMRRTAITVMLMMGMKEHIVRQISGHAAGSKSFYRYVNLVQSYIDNEMDAVFDRLANAV